MLNQIRSKIINKKIKIGIIGLGYVGLPLAEAFSKTFPVVGFDLNISRIKQLKSGIDQNLIKRKKKNLIQKFYLQIN